MAHHRDLIPVRYPKEGIQRLASEWFYMEDFPFRTLSGWAFLSLLMPHWRNATAGGLGAPRRKTTERSFTSRAG